MGRAVENPKPLQVAVTWAKLADSALESMWPALVGMVVLLLAATAWLALDRAPPFAVTGLPYPPPTVRPGEEVALRATVYRDMTRECSADMERRILFSDVRRIDITPAHFTAREIALQEARSPGRMAPVISVPIWAPIGRADLITTLRYRCNVTHDLVPITVVMAMPFEVVP